MNKGKLKNYAPKARREFIQAVTDRAAFYGLTKNNSIPMEETGDFTIIAGRAFPISVKRQREALEERIAESSFDHVMEEIAYTWFNRFVAIRYMELHGYLSHGYRVLSHPESDNQLPEIIEKAQYVDLPGLNKERVVELKMDGTKDEELYRMLLIAQCNELNKAMPFLFESIRDCTELLLPDNLLHSDSLIRKLVNEIDEADWQQVEIIGWMYQFYISEKKDEVIGSVVKSEDIPAATQLFTPNWIVKYLVQNSLGAQWMRTYPHSALKSKMEYYIEPAQQTEVVQKQLKEITPDALNPEELTILDPAAGSGHILVEAYDLLKEIYLERGYRKKDIPERILKKNLFGLEIDDRAAQLAGFAVMMKARADDRGLFDDRGIRPNIISIQESHGLDVAEIVRAINSPLTEKEVDQTPASLEELQTAIETPLFVPQDRKKGILLNEQEKLTVGDLKALLGLFEHGKTFGSLIRIPEKLAQKLPSIAARINIACKSGNLSGYGAAQKVLPFTNQALIMTGRYDAVIANPPYMGSNGMNSLLKNYVKDEFPDTKSDLFAMFIERGFELAKSTTGHNAMVTMQSWMFLSSYEKMREHLLDQSTIRNMVHMSNGVMGIAFGTAATVWFNEAFAKYQGSFSYVSHNDLNEKNIPVEFPVKNNRLKEASSDDFKKIPGSPIAYWANDKVLKVFELSNLENVSESGGRCKTHGDELYLRYLWEVSKEDVGVNSKWCQLYKGGSFRKYYGNREILIKWTKQAKDHYQEHGGLTNPKFWELEGITWTIVTSKEETSFRIKCNDGQYSSVSPTIFINNNVSINVVLCLLNSIVADQLFKIMNPTLALNVGNVLALPIPQIEKHVNKLHESGISLVDLSKSDWNSFETSWDFSQLPFISKQLSTINASYSAYHQDCREMTTKMKELEEENNRLFIEAYGLQEELTPDVPEEQITLFANPKYRYGGNLSDEDLEKRFREDTIAELISYSIGCMMGRYSLDEPGLIYAHAGNEGFDFSKYKKFPSDNDGIIPITDIPWFSDDVTERFFKFIETVWGKQALEENLEFIAESIGQKTSESSRDTIRRYFANNFFKEHLKTYKKRPIYWLFSSGKEKALQCLIYLHRYNEGTLSRMRTEYLIPLQGMIRQRIEHLNQDVEHASSASAANKIRKDIKTLEKQAEELRNYDEQLRHYADLKLKLDLDDGVKVNYGKFGDLLAEVKAITGSKEDE